MEALRAADPQTVAIADLRPTQITIGMREMRAKREAWRARDRRDARDFLKRMRVPVVRGPGLRCFLLDHHHLCRALYEEGVRRVRITVHADLHRMEGEPFWTIMAHRDWLHPFDAAGRRCSHRDLPATVMDLVDDPYRSLASALRHVGGFAKDEAPFSEFLWADFLRRWIGRARLDADFDAALTDAQRLARSRAADHLPGWCGAAPA